VGEWCPGTLFGVAGNAICHDREAAWREAGRPGQSLDWRKAMAWYMFHVWHDQGTTFVRRGGGMNCMPPEFKAGAQLIELELEEMRDSEGRKLKPDGSIY